MRNRLLTLASAFAVAFTLNGLVRADDTTKKDECDKSAKKDSCGDGCCGGAAKKNDDCEACKKSPDQACGECQKKYAASADAKPVSYTLKVNGMTCGGCAGAVKGKLEKIDGVAKAEVSLEKGATIEVAAGKAVKLGDVEKAIGPKFTIDPAAELGGCVRITVSGTTCGGCTKAVTEKLNGIKVEKVACALDAEKKTCTFTFCLGEKSAVSTKSLRDLFDGDKKFVLAEIELVGAQKSADASKKS